MIYTYSISNSPLAVPDLILSLLGNFMVFILIADMVKINDNNPTWIINKTKKVFLKEYKILQQQQDKLSLILDNKNKIIKQIEENEQCNDKDFVDSNKPIKDFIVLKRNSIAKLLNEIKNKLGNASIMAEEIAFMITSVYCLDVNLLSDTTEIEFNAQFYHDIIQLVMTTDDLENKIKAVEEVNSLIA